MTANIAAYDSATGLPLGATPGGPVWTIVTKASDESVTSSSTVQADDALQFAAASGGLYEVALLIMYASPAGAGTPDLKVALGEDATARGTFVCVGMSTSDASQSVSLLATAGNNIVTFGTATTNRPVRIVGSYIGGGGTFQLLWSQNVSDANATIVRAGSVLRYRRLV